MFQPYQNDSQSQQIGQLVIENQQDKVTIYGDIDIYRSVSGLAQARQLQQLLTQIVQGLEQYQTQGNLLLDEEIKPQQQSQSSQIDNPFA
ncbi:hypothetical protein [Psychrobacter sp. I-STPA6b]|uniref:hypothetical protein n=1 Tax=Psychrobacter sp. I-STPA6b TaxID=2585718 RepID=UPI001D0C6ED3|nr:hypothetical protein [Psychrobacter sp. I-STPA6b]